MGVAFVLMTCLAGALVAAAPADQEAPPSVRRPEKYRSDPRRVMVKNAYVVLPDRSVRNVTPTPGEGFYGGACIHPEGKDVVVPGAAWAGRPRYSRDGKEIFFFSGITDGKYAPRGRHTLCRVSAAGGAWRVIPNDVVGQSSHGPDPDPDGRHLWYHAAVRKRWCLLKLPLAGGKPVRVSPPGFAKHHVAHPTIARNGVLSFDSRSFVKAR